MSDYMLDTTLVLINLSRAIFFIVNIWLNYSFLTSKRSLGFQIIAVTTTWFTISCLRELLNPIIPDHFLVGYILSVLYIVPFSLVFKETFHAKIFVFFMVFSLSQCNFLIFLYLEMLIFDQMVGALLFGGLLLQLLCIPLIRKIVRHHVANILEVIDQQNASFTFFPILAFVMLGFYGAQRTYSLSTFIPLVLCALLIGFSYYLIALSIDQTKRRQQLELLSITDSLTGLYNRRHMEQKIKQEYERYKRGGPEFTLIIADIDFFKKVNDIYGHECGDYVLKTISEDLRKFTREYDTVARWGGEEFIILLPSTNVEKTVGLAERIRETVEERKFVYENKVLQVTLTFGVSVIGCDDTTSTLIKKADVALYQGKQAGRNRVISFDNLVEVEMPAT